MKILAIFAFFSATMITNCLATNQCFCVICDVLNPQECSNMEIYNTINLNPYNCNQSFCEGLIPNAKLGFFQGMQDEYDDEYILIEDFGRCVAASYFFYSLETTGEKYLAQYIVKSNCEDFYGNPNLRKNEALLGYGSSTHFYQKQSYGDYNIINSMAVLEGDKMYFYTTEEWLPKSDGDPYELIGIFQKKSTLPTSTPFATITTPSRHNSSSFIFPPTILSLFLIISTFF